MITRWLVLLLLGASAATNATNATGANATNAPTTAAGAPPPEEARVDATNGTDATTDAPVAAAAARAGRILRRARKAAARYTGVSHAFTPAIRSFAPPPWWPTPLSARNASAEAVEQAAAPAAPAAPVGPPAPTIAVVTWNLAAVAPSPRDCAFLRGLRGHSIVCVGVQELEDLKPRRSEGARSAAWTRTLRRAFPPATFAKVADRAAGPVRLCVFARRRGPLTVAVAGVADVACGIGNVLRNKGAAAAFLEVSERRAGGARATLAVVNAHLAAHAPKVRERNADYWRCARELAAKAPWGAPDAADAAPGAETGRSPLLAAADLVVFCGDLNYRLDLPREEAERGVATGGLEALLENDQLTRERGRRAAFDGFAEGKIDFDPTFKYDKRAETYDSSKKARVPSWTDRVLFTPRAPRRKRGTPRPRLVLASYDAVKGPTNSDHRPVVATFALYAGDDADAPPPGIVRVAPAVPSPKRPS